MKIFFLVVGALIADLLIYIRLYKKYKENLKLEEKINNMTENNRKAFIYFFKD